jgi:hypothetical protein
MIFFYFLAVFVFFLAVMQWLFRKIDARQVLSCATQNNTSRLQSSAQTHQGIIKKR